MTNRIRSFNVGIYRLVTPGGLRLNISVLLTLDLFPGGSPWTPTPMDAIAPPEAEQVGTSSPMYSLKVFMCLYL